MRTVIHYLGIVVGVGGILMVIGFGAASQQYLDPARSPDDKLTTWFFPMSARASDFIEGGWRLRVLSYWGYLVFLVGGVLFGLTGTA